MKLYEVRYRGDHPIVKWMKGAFKERRDIFYTLSGEDFTTAGEALLDHLGEPDEQMQDTIFWRVTNEYGNFYVDLQKLFAGPPKDQEHRLSVTYRD